MNDGCHLESRQRRLVRLQIRPRRILQRLTHVDQPHARPDQLGQGILTHPPAAGRESEIRISLPGTSIIPYHSQRTSSASEWLRCMGLDFSSLENVLIQCGHLWTSAALRTVLYRSAFSLSRSLASALHDGAASITYPSLYFLLT